MANGDISDEKEKDDIVDMQNLDNNCNNSEVDTNMAERNNLNNNNNIDNRQIVNDNTHDVVVTMGDIDITAPPPPLFQAEEPDTIILPNNNNA